jgi:hypothetical protein
MIGDLKQEKQKENDEIDYLVLEYTEYLIISSILEILFGRVKYTNERTNP